MLRAFPRCQSPTAQICQLLTDRIPQEREASVYRMKAWTFVTTRGVQASYLWLHIPTTERYQVFDPRRNAERRLRVGDAVHIDLRDDRAARPPSHRAIVGCSLLPEGVQFVAPLLPNGHRRVIGGCTGGLFELVLAVGGTPEFRTLSAWVVVEVEQMEGFVPVTIVHIAAIR